METKQPTHDDRLEKEGLAKQLDEQAAYISTLEIRNNQLRRHLKAMRAYAHDQTKKLSENEQLYVDKLNSLRQIIKQLKEVRFTQQQGYSPQKSLA